MATVGVSAGVEMVSVSAAAATATADAAKTVVKKVKKAAKAEEKK